MRKQGQSLLQQASAARLGLAEQLDRLDAGQGREALVALERAAQRSHVSPLSLAWLEALGPPKIIGRPQ